MNRGASDRRFPYDTSALPFEMLRPAVRPRMKQADELIGIGINAGNIGSFKTIAMEAREREVIDCRRPSMLAGDNVVDLERKTVLRVRYLTVLAAIPGPVPDLLNQALVH